MEFAKSKMKTEVQLTYLRAKQHLQKCDSIKTALFAELDEQYKGAISEGLKVTF